MNADKIMKAGNVRKVHPAYMEIAEALSTVPQLVYVKIYKERVKASNLLCDNGKKEPIVNVGEDSVIGVELLIDEISQVVQFYGITSSEKGCGAEIVSSVVNAVPEDWQLIVVMDWSRGFWGVMKERHPRLVIY
jgi:hypothetical protein